MIDTLIANTVLSIAGAAGIAIIMFASERRCRKGDAAFEARLAARDAEALAKPQPVPIALDVPDWKPWRPDPCASEERLERALARLNATAASGATDDEADTPPTPPELPIDLGELAHRLSDAGYDGGPLRLAGVEVLPGRHVVVHLEPQGP